VPLRIVFCGTPAFALPTLRHLIAQSEFQIASVVTQPDRPRGRGHEISISPVKQVALDAGIEVYQPESIRSEEAFDHFKRLSPDAVVIIAYGQIVPLPLIGLPRLGWINLHASLLPRYRGAAPINWAIVNGETSTGVTTMRIDSGLDTGPTLLKHEMCIAPNETAPELSARLADAGAALMAETLLRLDKCEIAPMPQDNSQATFAPLLKREDGRIDWSLPARTIYNRIRGLQPWPGAFTSFRGKTCHIWGRSGSYTMKGTDFSVPSTGDNYGLGTILTRGSETSIVCGEGTELLLDFAQLEGRKRVTARDFVNGARIVPGERFD
jgi:methionyl-tRNA formyltransferase